LIDYKPVILAKIRISKSIGRGEFRVKLQVSPKESFGQIIKVKSAKF
jgi:hypothetical protein